MALLEIKGLGHRFQQTQALDHIDLTLEAGEVQALVGENGAGKSTLIKLLSGAYAKQSGELLWEGRPLTLDSPQHSLAAGIQVIHQERQLIPAFSAAENMYLGLAYERRGIGIDRRQMEANCQALLHQWGIELDVRRPASQLSPPEKTMVEVARVLMRPCKLLILDEPTASLTERETAVLFGVIDKLRRQGTAVLYVSHRLEEVFALSTRITVLRNGRVAAVLATAQTNKAELIRLMTDSQTAPQFVYQPRRGETLLEVKDLADTAGIVRQAAFDVHSGEILGIFGLAGSGRTELLECIYGSRRCRSGTISLEGKLHQPSPKRSLERGMVLISEDRQGKGLIANRSVEDNLLLAALDHFSCGGFYQTKAAQAACCELIRRLAIKTSSLSQTVKALSGGNQQKIVFARALLSEPKVFLCDEPTQAVDVGARAEIHRLLISQAEAGKAVVFVSSDLLEMLEICHRLVILKQGRTQAVLENDGLMAEQVLAYCYSEEGSV